MIEVAVNELRRPLIDLGWIDIAGGLVREQKIRVGDVEKTLPAFPDPEDHAQMILLTPDSGRSVITYFEVMANQNRGDVSGGRGHMFSSTVRLVAWFNTQRLAPSGVVPQAMAAMVSALAGYRFADVAPVGNIRVVPLQEVPKSPAIFARWTYDEAETQFLMPPFDYFAFDFSVSFTLSTFCPVVNIVKTDSTC